MKKNQEGKLSKAEKEKLVKDCMKYVEKSKTNSYTRANSIKGEALLRELNGSLKAGTDKPNKFP